MRSGFGERLRRLEQPVEMRDHPIGPEFAHGNVGIAEIDRDDGSSRRPRGSDVGHRIADHDRAADTASNLQDRLDERPGISAWRRRTCPGRRRTGTCPRRRARSAAGARNVRACWCRRPAASSPPRMRRDRPRPPETATNGRRYGRCSASGTCRIERPASPASNPARPARSRAGSAPARPRRAGIARQKREPHRRLRPRARS